MFIQLRHITTLFSSEIILNSYGILGEHSDCESVLCFDEKVIDSLATSLGTHTHSSTVGYSNSSDNVTVPHVATGRNF